MLEDDDGMSVGFVLGHDVTHVGDMLIAGGLYTSNLFAASDMSQVEGP